MPVKRGDQVATISATGKLEPEAAVDIGPGCRSGDLIALHKALGGGWEFVPPYGQGTTLTPTNATAEIKPDRK